MHTHQMMFHYIDLEAHTVLYYPYLLYKMLQVEVLLNFFLSDSPRSIFQPNKVYFRYSKQRQRPIHFGNHYYLLHKFLAIRSHWYKTDFEHEREQV